MVFNNRGKNIHLNVPYDNHNGYSGQIGIWIDFDGNGKFDADEFQSQPVTRTQTRPSSVTTQTGTENYYRNSAEFSIPVPKDTITYTLTISEIPSDVNKVKNIATDTGEMVEVCKPADKDCGEAIIPIEKN